MYVLQSLDPKMAACSCGQRQFAEFRLLPFVFFCCGLGLFDSLPSHWTQGAYGGFSWRCPSALVESTLIYSSPRGKNQVRLTGGATFKHVVGTGTTSHPQRTTKNLWGAGNAWRSSVRSTKYVIKTAVVSGAQGESSRNTCGARSKREISTVVPAALQPDCLERES